jgi:hypothetical protein
MCLSSITPLLAQDAEVMRYAGYIGEGEYEIRMSLQRRGDSVTGSYNYRHIGKPIKLIGTISGSSLVLNEIDEKGNTTATFTGTIGELGNEISGEWKKVGSAKQLSFSVYAGAATDITGTDNIDAEDRVIIEEKVASFKGGKGDARRGAIINYPAVSGLKNSPAVAKVRAALSPQNIFGQSLEEIRSAILADRATIVDASYAINYNKNYLLDITFSVETGGGAYPDNYNIHRLINLKTGEPVKASELFNQAMLKPLAAMVEKQLKAEIKKTIDENSKEDPDVDSYFEDKRYQLKDLNNISVDDKGVTFLYDYEFPHVIQALQPEGRFFFSYAQLKPYINPNGLLRPFIK